MTVTPLVPSATGPARYAVSQLDSLPSVACPCGETRRAFATPDNPVATIHLVDISTTRRPHYHKRLTEIYLVLEGDGKDKRIKDSPVNGTSAPVFRLMSDS